MLKKDERLVSQEGEILKNETQVLARKNDPELIKLLLSDKQIKKTFFFEIEKTLIFDKEKFIRFVSNKQFLPDSYTAFKNKIGLTSGDEYLSEGKEVVLAWPYKDCVLEGGMTKEDQKRDEIFYNETLAPDDIDRLLDPKAFTNFKRIDKKGEHNLKEFNRDEKGNIKDNLIIKGNNLLALASLKRQFAGKVKLIYIDPPYNTGDDGFGYNDCFNHSSWLTFFKNRLKIARDLLRDDGAIFIQIDHHELGYLNILMDEIFGINNKVQIIAIRTASPAGFKTVNPGPIDVTEYLLFYTKNKSKFCFKKAFVPVGYNKNYNLYVERKENLKDWKFMPIKEKVIQEAGFKNEKEAKKKYGNLWKSISKVMIEDFAFNNAEKVVSIRDPHKPTKTIKELMQKSKEMECPIAHKREDGSELYLYRGGALAFYSNKINIIDGERCVTELLTDFWSHISWAGIAKEGNVRLKNGKKPEKLIKQLLELATDEGDLVLDYHLGSGTTAAVAHKMKRRYIGVEQLDYEKDDSVIRIKNVIKGDSSGISKAIKWKGGGDFVCMELAKWNEEWIEKIEKAKTVKDLTIIWEEMKKTAFLSYKVDLKMIDSNAKEFSDLSLNNQRKLLIECLDKNQLYINHSEIEDKDYGVSKEDKRINKAFYRE